MPDQRSDALDPLDRIDLLWGEDHAADDEPEDRMSADDPSTEMCDPREDLLNLPDIPEARNFLTGSLKYQWLLGRVSAMAQTMPTLNTDVGIRTELVSQISGSSKMVEVQLDWSFSISLVVIG